MDTKSRDYALIICMVGVSAVAAYAPKDEVYDNPGSEVELENHARGIMLSCDRWQSYEDLQEFERKTGMELVKITKTYEVREVKWLDE